MDRYTCAARADLPAPIDPARIRLAAQRLAVDLRWFTETTTGHVEAGIGCPFGTYGPDHAAAELARVLDAAALPIGAPA